LMRLVPAITELTNARIDGRQQLKLSRVDLDERDTSRDLSGRPGFGSAVEHGLAYSKTYFKDGSEPYVTLAVRDKDKESVTLVELNLKFVSEIVGQIRVGKEGGVYVVDGADQVVAHPDATITLRHTDLSLYPPLRELRIAAKDTVARMIEAPGLEGGMVLISAAPILSAQWLVVTEQPKAEVLAPVYESLARSAVLLICGLLAAILLSYFLARRLSRPILEVRKGAERVASGEFSARIDVKTGDEVEALANEFNRMAEQLQDYTTGLERKVAEKTFELETANRHKSEFLANMSHELRTPLNAVIGFSDALKEKMFGELNAKQLEYVQDIHASGQHLLSLINDILDLSKIEAGRMELDPQAFDVAAALDNCRTLIRERARGRGLRLSFGVPDNLGQWVGDARKFKQIVLNLLSNAVKFTPPGGEVSLAARNEPDALVVAVTDTGPGIAPADQAIIFEEFRQLKVLGDPKEGTGLGLALTRRLVELHGGTIRVESAKGRGATFTVRFPRAPAEGANV
jgi:signal transduction histidine kinase